MSFFTVLSAVVFEHLRPLRQPLPHYQQYARFTQWLEHKFNANAFSHGAIAWMLAVVPLLLGVWLIDWLLGGVTPFLSWVWNVAVLYFTLGFKYFSDDAERIAQRLRAGELEAARTQLGTWRGGDTSQFSADEVARVTIEQVMAASHRQMFGVLLCYVVLVPFGPVGAVLFRTASILARRWAKTTGHFGVFAQRAFHAINWLPARLTGLTYAIAGSFEDAMYCWRTQAESWPEQEDSVVLAAGAGAMGIRLGQPINVGGETVWRPELGSGQSETDADCIDSSVSMIWRGLVIWMVAGLLVLVAGWVA